MVQTYDNYYKDYYNKNREQILEKRRNKYHNKLKAAIYYDKHKRGYGDAKSYSRQWRMWYSAKVRAKQFNLPFDIVVEDIKIPTHCPILGIKLDTDYTDKTWQSSPSLDRVVPDKGYVKGNIAIISKKANRMKQDVTPEIAKKILNYILKRI